MMISQASHCNEKGKANPADWIASCEADVSCENVVDCVPANTWGFRNTWPWSSDGNLCKAVIDESSDQEEYVEFWCVPKKQEIHWDYAHVVVIILILALVVMLFRNRAKMHYYLKRKIAERRYPQRRV